MVIIFDMKGGLYKHSSTGGHSRVPTDSGTNHLQHYMRFVQHWSPQPLQCQYYTYTNASSVVSCCMCMCIYKLDQYVYHIHLCVHSMLMTHFQILALNHSPSLSCVQVTAITPVVEDLS